MPLTETVEWEGDKRYTITRFGQVLSGQVGVHILSKIVIVFSTSHTFVCDIQV